MSNPVEALLQHDHESLSQLLTKLDQELARSNTIAAFELLDRFWAGLALHIRAENLELFPALSNLATTVTGSASGPSSDDIEVVLSRLRADHNFFMTELATAIKTMRAVVAGELPKVESVASVQNRLAAIRQRLEDHNRIEEEQAYKWPELVLSDSEQTALRNRLQHELENIPPRFADSLQQ
jgi:iron-sulfur cluster repair protein YtfE (RIC family)